MLVTTPKKPSPKGADLRAPFFVQFFVFWDIFWATIYEKPLTEHSARGFSGESEIRTRDTLLGYTRFPGVPLQPLEHLSNTYPGKSGLQR